MRVHHLDCVSLCPPGGRWFDGRSKVLGRSRLVCHCVLVETDGGLLLVDTGLGLNDVRHPRRRLSPVFRVLLRPRLEEAATALRQIEHLGFRADDVRHIVLTHLDFDHAGGLDDFPAATRTGTRAWPYGPTTAGSCTRATRTSTAARWTRFGAGARWGCGRTRRSCSRTLAPGSTTCEG